MNIKCKCGNEFKKDYSDGWVLVGNQELGNCYQWTCKECGQTYLEKFEPPIILE